MRFYLRDLIFDGKRGGTVFLPFMDRTDGLQESGRETNSAPVQKQEAVAKNKMNLGLDPSTEFINTI